MDDVVHITADRVGATFATGSYDGTMALWNGVSLTTVWREQMYPSLVGRPAVTDVALSPVGSVLAASAFLDKPRLWEQSIDPNTYESFTHSANSLQFSANGRTLFVGDGLGPISIWDVETRQQRVVLKGHNSSVDRLALSADETTLVSTSRDGTIRIWRAATEQEVRNAGKWWEP